jgi:putative intracellular protease/amidase
MRRPMPMSGKESVASSHPRLCFFDFQEEQPKGHHSWFGFPIRVKGNAGGTWVDREVVEDGNWVTSRQPGDLPAFNRAMLGLFSGSLVPGRK